MRAGSQEPGCPPALCARWRLPLAHPPSLIWSLSVAEIWAAQVPESHIQTHLKL